MTLTHGQAKIDKLAIRRSRLVQAGAWTLGLYAVVALEENDRVNTLKVAEETARRECAGRNLERRRRPARAR